MNLWVVDASTNQMIHRCVPSSSVMAVHVRLCGSEPRYKKNNATMCSPTNSVALSARQFQTVEIASKI